MRKGGVVKVMPLGSNEMLESFVSMNTLCDRQALHIGYYPAYGEIPDLGHLNVYVQWWRDILARDGRPTRKDIAFTDLRGLHSRITLCRILEDRSGMVAHILGEDVKALFRNYMPNDQADLESATHLRELVGTEKAPDCIHMHRIADQRNIVVSSGTLALASKRTIDISAMDFPLAPMKGEMPYVLTIYDFDTAFQDRNVSHYGLISRQDALRRQNNTSPESIGICRLSYPSGPLWQGQ